jgi:hypothetical protein
MVARSSRVEVLRRSWQISVARRQVLTLARAINREWHGKPAAFQHAQQ